MDKTALGKKKDDEEEGEDKDEDDTPSKKVTLKEADGGLQTFIKFAERLSSIAVQNLMQLY
ncbi:hypothetical protein AVEN_12789-1, partial [Araneus ventricosus]